ncbi:MAG: GspE/PulE family protein [Thermodesulfobacteriota bacterium]
MTESASDTNPQLAETELFLSQYGEIISILLKSSYLTRKQIEYAERIRKKLPTPKPLLDILKELKYITDERVREALRANRVSLKIGSLLLELGYIAEADLQAAFAHQLEDKSKKLGEILVSHGFIDEKKLVEILSLQLGFPYIELEFTDIDRQLFASAPTKFYENHHFIPIRKEAENVLVAFADPLDQKDLDGARGIFGRKIIPAFALRSEITSTIEKIKRGAKARRSIDLDEDSIAGLVNAIIISALENRVSDIHIEPMQDRLRIRFRQDGVLQHYKDYPPDISPALASRIKVMCQADIAEKRRHQGGRIFFDHAGGQLDLRVSVYVTVYGEKIVMRLLNRKGQLMHIDQIGMLPRMLERFRDEALLSPSGVLIITGPTGAGKTSTVYSCINHINTPQISIITAEEPVEYIIDGIAQCSINPKINLTFEETLRHIVRQDPDVIVIGEIRDNYSAEVAVHAALTGHKVLTTFHTEDSIGGLIRLLNMDIEAFLISSTVVCVVAQRLLRRICSSCAMEYTPTTKEIQFLGYGPTELLGANFKRGKGCSQCKHTGYLGRTGVFELLILEEPVRNAILERKTSHEIRKISIESTGLVTLFEDGIVKAADGITTIEEVLRCLPKLLKPRPLSTLRRLEGI